MDKLSKLVINRSKWLHQEGSISSYLLRMSDGKRCCLGHYLSACGMSDKQLEQVSAPGALSLHHSLPEQALWLLHEKHANSADARILIAANDKCCLDTKPLTVRAEETIVRVFGEHGVEVVFEGE